MRDEMAHGPVFRSIPADGITILMDPPGILMEGAVKPTTYSLNPVAQSISIDGQEVSAWLTVSVGLVPSQLCAIWEHAELNYGLTLLSNAGHPDAQGIESGREKFALKRITGVGRSGLPSQV